MSDGMSNRRDAELKEVDYSLPPTGMPESQRKRCMKVFTDYIDTQRSNFMGYQANQKMDYEDDTKHFLNAHVNNIGDPFTEGNFTVNSKEMEKAVLDYYAELWRAETPHSPEDPESFWGYVLTMGSSEGNLYGLWNARDYLAGRKLIVDSKDDTGKRANYLQAKSTKENEYTPVAFFSQDTHYSIVKAMRVLQIPTFYDIGMAKKYVNPLNPKSPEDWKESWKGYEEVPSLDGNDGPGCIDVDALGTLVDFFAGKGYPILVSCNYASTFKGAYDDVESIDGKLFPLFKKHGLVDRTVTYEPGHTDVRNGYWIHVDGALGASYMPFIEMAHDQNPGAIDKGPAFDFRLKTVNSIVMSGHKWPGAPWPCGIFMTKVKYQLFPPDDPEYLGSPDTTFAGSRNGFSAIIMWNYLAKHSYGTQMEQAVSCERMSKIAKEQLDTVKAAHPKLDLWIERTPLALTVRFREPNDDIIEKYSLSCETLRVNGEERTYAHIFMMASVTEALIKKLVADLKQPGAFDRKKREPLTTDRARAWR